MANLPGLPAELLNNIVYSCSHSDIKHLSETCRLLHNKMLPELFRNLDLSTHNATVECRHDGFRENSLWNRATDLTTVPPRFLAREWHHIDRTNARKQGLLIRTVAEKPHYGKYVRELHWTVLDSYQNIVCRQELLEARPCQWHGLFAEMSVRGPGIRLSPSDKLEVLWKAFHDHDRKETWDHAYETYVGNERETFPPEDGRLWH